MDARCFTALKTLNPGALPHNPKDAPLEQNTLAHEAKPLVAIIYILPFQPLGGEFASFHFQSKSFCGGPPMTKVMSCSGNFNAESQWEVPTALKPYNLKSLKTPKSLEPKQAENP